jgi:RNA polymerase-binding protein DksA
MTKKKVLKMKPAKPPRKFVRPVTPKRKATPAKPAKKPANKPVPAKKLLVKPTPVNKFAVKPVPVKKPAAKPVPARKPAAPVKSAPARPVKPAPAAAPRKSTLSRKELEDFRKRLLTMRDSIVDEISFLAGENLNKNPREASGDLSNYGLHMADQGTDNFDREFALNLVSNEQNVLYEIDEAIQRIETNTFGMCEQTGLPIETERLKAMPYTRLSLVAQEELERKNKRRRTFSSGSSFGSGNQEY